MIKKYHLVDLKKKIFIRSALISLGSLDDILGLNDYLSNIGFENGTDFDVKLPGKIITTDGRREELPLSISFNNGRDFTRIDIYRDQDGKTTINSYSGNREDGVDVGYEGPVSKGYRPRDFQSTKFE